MWKEYTVEWFVTMEILFSKVVFAQPVRGATGQKKSIHSLVRHAFRQTKRPCIDHLI